MRASAKKDKTRSNCTSLHGKSNSEAYYIMDSHRTEKLKQQDHLRRERRKESDFNRHLRRYERSQKMTEYEIAGLPEDVKALAQLWIDLYGIPPPRPGYLNWWHNESLPIAASRPARRASYMQCIATIIQQQLKQYKLSMVDLDRAMRMPDGTCRRILQGTGIRSGALAWVDKAFFYLGLAVVNRSQRGRGKPPIYYKKIDGDLAYPKADQDEDVTQEEE